MPQQIDKVELERRVQERIKTKGESEVVARIRAANELATEVNGAPSRKDALASACLEP